MKRILIIGNAGSGKTTALMYLSSVLAGKIKAGSSQILPVYIPLPPPQAFSCHSPAADPLFPCKEDLMSIPDTSFYPSFFHTFI